VELEALVRQKAAAAAVQRQMDLVEMAEREPFQIFQAHHFNMAVVAHLWGLGLHRFMAQPLAVVVFLRLTARM
jgi:hypothetical protein